MTEWRFGTIIEHSDGRGPVRMLIIGNPTEDFICDDDCTIGPDQTFGIVLTCPRSRGGYPIAGTAWVEHWEEWVVVDD